MASVSEFILNFIVNATWQIALIALVAAAGSLLLRNAQARYRHVLWLAALILCVTVPVVCLVLPRMPAFSALPADQSAVIEAASTRAPQMVSTSISPEPDLLLARLTTRRTRVVNSEPLPAFWLTLAFALFLAWRVTRLVRFFLRRSPELENIPIEAEQVAQRCRTIFGIKRVELKQSSGTRVPYTTGARRPLIVLPQAFSVAPEEHLLSVIGHEMAHVARCDYLTNLICELALLPISFHPLAFVVKKQVDRERELACDELVSKHLLAPKIYARSLVWAADVSSAALDRARSQGLILRMFDARSLEERVIRLVRNRKTLSLRLAKVITSMMLFVLCAAALSLSLFSLELKTEARALFTQPPSVEANGNSPVAPVETVSPIVTINTQHPGAQARPAETRSAEGQPAAARPAEVQGINNQPTDPNAEQRAAAACEAGRNGDVEKIPSLVALLADDTKTKLLRCWSSGRWSPALETFKHPSPGEQAAIALASMGRPAFLSLANQLDSANPTVRRNAAWAIGELTNMRPGERDGAAPRLISLLTDSDAWVRTAAARSLGELRTRSAVPALIANLADADPRVRELAVWALSELKDKRAVAALCNVLLSDSRADVRRGAAEALGEIRSAEALPALKQALNDATVNDRAQWAISEIEGDE